MSFNLTQSQIRNPLPLDITLTEFLSFLLARITMTPKLNISLIITNLFYL